MAFMPTVSDQILRDAYAEYRNIRRVAELVGLHPSSVHERLQKLGIKTPPSHVRFFTEGDRERLRKDYRVYADHGRLGELAEEMGRTRQLLAREARKLGLITEPHGRGHRKLWKSLWKYIDGRQAQIIWDDFCASRMGMGAYCRKHGYDDLGFSKKMKEFFGDEWEHVLKTKVPKQSLYRRGRQLEYRVRDSMEKLGFFVLRSPASKSPVDLVAIKRGLLLLIQCKRAGSLPPQEWNALFELAQSIGGLPLMAAMHPSGRGSIYMLLTALKLQDGSKRPQPWVAWTPEQQHEEQSLPFGG